MKLLVKGFTGIFSHEKRNKGFTLIELMIVTIITGLLAAIAYPQITSQAGKAREVELKQMLGTIIRAQQTYHWEKSEFAQGANGLEVLAKLGVKPLNRYIDDYIFDTTSNYTTIVLVNNDFLIDTTRGFSGGVFVAQGQYTLYSCQSDNITAQIVAPTAANGCNPQKKIR